MLTVKVRDGESMGVSLSNLVDESLGFDLGTGLGDISKSCVTCVFLYLTPLEIYNLVRQNCTFRNAASSNSVWEAKLPMNYQDLLDLFPLERYKS